MKPVRLRELAEELDAELLGDGDAVITGVAGLEEAGPGDLTFLANGERVDRLVRCQASAVIIGPQVATDRPALRVEDPYLAFAGVLSRFETDVDRLFPPGIHPTAVVDPTATIGAGVAVGPHSVIGPGCRIGSGSRLGPLVAIGPDVTIGADCRIHAGVCIRERCEIGSRVFLQPGCVIGSDGFGYRPTAQGLRKVPQVGIVVIEDDVEIGAGACVDRATTGRTVIGRGTKLDNLVQIGHNVNVGSHCAVSAQTGISGSCRLGDRVTMGGQVGLADHLTIGNGVRIGAKSGLHRDVPDGAEVFGYPALDAREAFRIAGALRKLPDLIKTVARLEKELAARTAADEDGEA